MLGLHVVGAGVARSTTWMYNRARNARAVVAEGVPRVSAHSAGMNENFSRFKYVTKIQSRAETLKTCESELKGVIPDVQYKKLTKTIKKASGKDQAAGIDTATFNIKIEEATGNIHLEAMRSGYDGHQKMSHNIALDGERTRVVQTAFSNDGNIVAQRPGATKNNLFDLKR